MVIVKALGCILLPLLQALGAALCSRPGGACRFSSPTRCHDPYCTQPPSNTCPIPPETRPRRRRAPFTGSKSPLRTSTAVSAARPFTVPAGAGWQALLKPSPRTHAKRQPAQQPGVKNPYVFLSANRAPEADSSSPPQVCSCFCSRFQTYTPPPRLTLPYA
jgi:hypothetical protein